MLTLGRGLHGAPLWGYASQSDQAPVLMELASGGRGKTRFQGQEKAMGTGQPFVGKSEASGRGPTTLVFHSSAMVTIIFVHKVLLLYPSCEMVDYLDEEPGF